MAVTSVTASTTSESVTWDLEPQDEGQDFVYPRRQLTMLYTTLSVAVYGIDANVIQVEVDCSGIKCDQDHFHTVGRPDAAVRESRDRVRAALKNCGYDIPPPHITINLAPADIKKEGSGFDLPMALGIVGAYGGLT